MTAIPAKALMKQYAIIAAAVELLQNELTAIEDTDPDTATWATVGEHAKAADVARRIIEDFEEN